MANSSLEHTGETPPTQGKGHGTAALGPSDSTDSGSDIQGGKGLNRDGGLFKSSGTTSDPDVDGEGANAGADIGDANLDSDSDRNGTGERAAAGRDSTLPNDQILHDTESDEVVDGDSIGDDVDREEPLRDQASNDVERESISENGDRARRDDTSH
ncbi:MAG TPA: hypothetical protein VNG69_06125 [Casimicrobiaceae bacterium]|nr:hypothetical protein [Casimicrobiaceae bacterium]